MIYELREFLQKRCQTCLALSNLGQQEKSTSKFSRNKIGTLVGDRKPTLCVKASSKQWAAHWLLGKSYEAICDYENFYTHMSKSYHFNKNNPDVAREYMLSCLRTGRFSYGVNAARHALGLLPDNPGLIANLGLALFLDGQLDEAAKVTRRAIEFSPDDQISRSLLEAIEGVRSGTRPIPKSLALDINNNILC